jgi:hypothetical protein
LLDNAADTVVDDESVVLLSAGVCSGLGVAEVSGSALELSSGADAGEGVM